MGHQGKSSQPYEEEAVTITMPAHVLEAIESTLTTQLTSGHSSLESSSFGIAAMGERGEPFPCFKKSAWDDEIIVKITPAHPGADTV